MTHVFFIHSLIFTDTQAMTGNMTDNIGNNIQSTQTEEETEIGAADKIKVWGARVHNLNTTR